MMRRLTEHLDSVHVFRLCAYLALPFSLAQLAYHLAGVRFDASTLEWFWQFLDPRLLEKKLLESLFYLHSQPPLFNLFLGVVVKLCPPGVRTHVFQALLLLAGYVLYCATVLLQRSLGVRPWTALVLGTWFMLSPSFVLYENWLYYEFPLAAILATSVLAMRRALNGRPVGWVMASCALLAAACLIRSAFHPLYYVVMAAFLVALRPRRRAATAGVAGALLVPLLALYLKNFLLFGVFAASTWTGMHVWTMTGRNVPHGLRRALAQEGRISEVALVERFSSLSEYPERFWTVPPRFQGIEVLENPTKAGGSPNFNHVAYIAISQQYLHDARTLALRDPKCLLIGQARAWASYFKASSDYGPVARNESRIPWMCALYDELFYGKIPVDLRRFAALPIYSKERPQYVYVFLLFGLPLLFGYGLKMAWSGMAGDTRLSRDRRLLVALLCANIGYVACVGNIVEVGENHRFRFLTDAFTVTLLGCAVHYSLVPRIKRRWGSRPMGALTVTPPVTVPARTAASRWQDPA